MLIAGPYSAAARLPTLVVAVLLASAGCALPIGIADINRDVPAKTMPLIVHAGLDALGDAATKEQLQRVLADPQLRAAQKELVSGLVDGALASFSDRERAERIGALTSKAVDGIVRSALRELASELPAATGGALDAALSPERRRALQDLVSAVSTAMLHATIAGLREAHLGQDLAGALTQELGPALRKSLRQDLGPGLAEALDNEELNRALGAMAHRLGREMVLGATEALAQTQPRADGSLLARVTELAHQGARLFGTAAWLLVLIIVALIAWTLKLRAQARGYRQEAERRAATAHFLNEVTRAAAGKPWADELIAALQERVCAEEEAIAERHGRDLGTLRNGAAGHRRHYPDGDDHTSRPH